MSNVNRVFIYSEVSLYPTFDSELVQWNHHHAIRLLTGEVTDFTRLYLWHYSIHTENPPSAVFVFRDGVRVHSDLLSLWDSTLSCELTLTVWFKLLSGCGVCFSAPQRSSVIYKVVTSLNPNFLHVLYVVHYIGYNRHYISPSVVYYRRKYQVIWNLSRDRSRLG